MTRVQFSQSRLRTSSRIGEPSVTAVADAAEDLGPVLLDRLARAAAVARAGAGRGRPRGRPRSAPGRPGRPRSWRRAPGRAIPRRSGSGNAPIGPAVARSRPPSVRRASRRRLALGREPAVCRSPVGSPSAERTPPARASASFVCMSSSGAGWPVHSVNAAAPWWSSISSPSRDRRPGRRRVAEQPGPGVDQVQDQEVGVEDLGRDRARRRWSGRSTWR